MTKRSSIILVIIIVVFALVIGGFTAAKKFLPYEITASGETIAVVNNEKDGEKVIKKVIQSYVPKGTDVSSISIDKNLKLEQVGFSDILGIAKDATDVKTAINNIKKANSGDNALFNVTIKSQKTKKEKYTPEIEYKKDETMLAGQSKVERESKDGLRNTTYELTSVNGKVTDKRTSKTEVLEKGTSKIIVKGTLGVPTGKDWKTYEGKPVFNNGDDVVTTAKQHLGCPYKYGGYSFKTGIDCVQYVRNIYRMYGVNLPNNHPGLRKVGSKVSIKNAKPGDIICYKHHVAIYAGNGKMAEATRKHGTRVGKVRSGIITVRRVNKSN